MSKKLHPKPIKIDSPIDFGGEDLGKALNNIMYDAMRDFQEKKVEAVFHHLAAFGYRFESNAEKMDFLFEHCHIEMNTLTSRYVLYVDEIPTLAWSESMEYHPEFRFIMKFEILRDYIYKNPEK